MILLLPKFVGFKVLKRQPFRMPVIFQFPESGFDALSLMVKPVKLFCGKSEAGGNSVVKVFIRHVPSFFFRVILRTMMIRVRYAVFQYYSSDITDGERTKRGIGEAVPRYAVYFGQIPSEISSV